MKVEDEPELSPDHRDHVEYEVARARRLLRALGAEGASGDKAGLYIGLEGRPISERVLKSIFEDVGVVDLRQARPGPGHDAHPDAEMVFEAPIGDGITLRLTRFRQEGGSTLVDLEAWKSGQGGGEARAT